MRISSINRKNTSILVSSLYQGATIQLSDSEGKSRYICFRMRGEPLPSIPGAKYGVNALNDGVYVSKDIVELSNGVQQVKGSQWAVAGNLDTIHETLGEYGDPSHIASECARIGNVRSLQSIPAEQDVFKIFQTQPEPI